MCLKKIERIVACSTLLAYSNLFRSFEMYTDVKRYTDRSYYHIDFYIGKLTWPLKLFGNINEQLIIVWTLKDFKTIYIAY